MTDRKMHLMGFLINSPINHTALSWADDRDQRAEGLGDFEYWKNLARTLERGFFDGVFFADTPGTYDLYKDRRDESIEFGVCSPPHDPMPLVAVMASATDHLGFGVTLSTAAVQPYTAVRTIGTLDFLSQGRVGWNVVTGHLRSEHRALGLDQLGHDERYERAEEYMEICYALWDSWSPGSVLWDRESGRFADPSKVTVVEHQGKYLRCSAPGPALPSKQGRPVIFQAGSSARGAQFAAKHAEIVFAIQPTRHAMDRFMEKHQAAADSIGVQAPGVLLGAQFIVGSTREEALREQSALLDRIPVEAGLARLSGTLGTDFSKFDLDDPLSEMKTEGSQGLMAALTSMFGGGGLTIREAAKRWGASTGMPQVVGTPDEVAAELIDLWSATGAAGFNLTPTYTPGSFEIFVDEVVPLLQKAGVLRTEYTGSTFRENLLDS